MPPVHDIHETIQSYEWYVKCRGLALEFLPLTMGDRSSLDRMTFLAQHLGLRLSKVLKYELQQRRNATVNGPINLETFLAGLYRCFPRQAIKFLGTRESFERLLLSLNHGDKDESDRTGDRAKNEGGNVFYVDFDPALMRIFERAVTVAISLRRKSVDIEEFVEAISSEEGEAILAVRNKWGIGTKEGNN
jgi:hypothetical protein